MIHIFYIKIDENKRDVTKVGKFLILKSPLPRSYRKKSLDS